MTSNCSRSAKSTTSSSWNASASYSRQGSCAFAFFVHTNPTCMALRASQVSFVESLPPNDSTYSGDTARRIPSMDAQSSSSYLVLISMACYSFRARSITFISTTHSLEFVQTKTGQLALPTSLTVCYTMTSRRTI